MAQSELNRLLIKNLADLESAAAHIVGQVEPAIAAGLGSVVAQFKTKNQWSGSDETDTEEWWVAPDEWRCKGPDAADGFDAWFSLIPEDNSWSGYQFWSAALVGAGKKQAGLRWTRNDVSKAQWRKTLGDQQDLIAKIRSRGFLYQEAQGSFFFPLRLDAIALADAVADEDPELAMEPLISALQACKEARGEFDELLAIGGRGQ